MTKNEFKQAVEMVEKGADLSKYDDSNLFGCGLPDFQPVFTTIGAVAKLVCYQARTLVGTWDAAELDAMAKIAKKKFKIISG